MSSVNIGNQKIYYRYKQPVLSYEFNKVLNNIIDVGVYEGLDVTIVDNTKVRVSSGVCYIRDDTKDLAVRIDFDDNFIVNVNVDTPFVVIKYRYYEEEENYADVFSTSYNNILDDYVILCKCIFDSNNNLIDIDYYYRTIPDVYNFKKSVSIYLSPTEPYSKSVLLKKGVFYINGNKYVLNNDIVIDFPDNNFKKIYVIFIDKDGQVYKKESFDTNGFSYPDFKDTDKYFVGYVIKYSDKVITGNDIKDLGKYYYRNYIYYSKEKSFEIIFNGSEKREFLEIYDIGQRAKLNILYKFIIYNNLDEIVSYGYIDVDYISKKCNVYYIFNNLMVYPEFGYYTNTVYLSVNGNYKIIMNEEIITCNNVSYTYYRDNNEYSGYVIFFTYNFYSFVVDNLETDNSYVSLSAKQGKVLNDNINTINDNINTINDNINTINDNINSHTTNYNNPHQVKLSQLNDYILSDDLNANNKKIINLPYPSSNTEPVRLQDMLFLNGQWVAMNFSILSSNGSISLDCSQYNVFYLSGTDNKTITLTNLPTGRYASFIIFVNGSNTKTVVFTNSIFYEDSTSAQSNKSFSYSATGYKIFNFIYVNNLLYCMYSGFGV